MTIAESKGDAPAYATANNDERAAAKDTTIDEAAVSKDTDMIMERGVEVLIVDGEVETMNVACGVETVNAEVHEVVADLVTAATKSTEKRRETSAAVANPRKRRRAVLQDSSEDECDGTGLDEAASPASFLRAAPPPCVVNGDTNLMDYGAEPTSILTKTLTKRRTVMTKSLVTWMAMMTG